MILAGQALFHGLLAALAGEVRQPAQAEGLTAVGPDLDRDLIVGAADTAGLDLQGGHDVFHRLLEGFQAVLAGLFFDDLKSAVDNFLRNALFAVEHDAIDELGHQNRMVHRIRQNFSFGNITSSGHFASLLHRMIS